MDGNFATVYCDESGNTGPNLMSKEDPFFVYSWVLVTNDQEAEIEEKVSNLLIEDKLNLTKELSSEKLWRSSKGCARYKRVLGFAYDAGAHIFVTYGEKIFEACLLVIGTYLDPDNNPNVPPKLLDHDFPKMLNREFGITLANAIYDSIPRDILTRFVEACNKDDVIALKEVGERIARLIILNPNDVISNAGRVMMAGVDNPFRYGEKIDQAPLNSHLTSPHVAIFTPALFYVDHILDTMHMKARLIRDRDLQFGPLLDFVFQTAKSELNNIVSSTDDDSESRVGIQLADLAAGVTLRILKLKHRGKTIRNRYWNIWIELRRSLLRGSWSYQLTSVKCEDRLNSIWSDLGASAASGIWKDNTLQCSCGERISSGKMRDFYLHVIECHPSGEVMGFPCEFCKELIPFGLSVCHQVKDHGLSPPLRGDFFADVSKDYEVFKKLKATEIRVVVPHSSSSQNEDPKKGS